MSVEASAHPADAYALNLNIAKSNATRSAAPESILNAKVAKLKPEESRLPSTSASLDLLLEGGGELGWANYQQQIVSCDNYDRLVRERECYAPENGESYIAEPEWE